MSSASYKAIVSRPAQKEIRSLEQITRVRILRALRALTGEPRPSSCRKLVGAHNRWRIRVGDHRIIYAVNDANHIIDIIAVRHLSKAYD